jgi:hypothetical protein
MTKTTKFEEARPVLSPEALAGLGGGQVAYVKAMLSEDVNRIFPGTPPIEPGLKLFALLAADGTPILISDSRDAALANAMEHDLRTVAVH